MVKERKDITRMDSSEEHNIEGCGEALLSLLDIEQLEQRDTSLSRFLEESFDRWYEKVCMSSPNLPLPLAFGAALEGGWSTGFMRSEDPNHPLALNINILQPFVFLKTLSQVDYKLRVVDVGKAGFVNVRLLGVDLADTQSLRELVVMDSEDGEWYLSPKLAVELFAYHAQIARKQPFYCHLHDPETVLETVLRGVYGPEKEVAEDGFDFEAWEDDPEIQTKIETMPCVECDGWPDAASQWPRSDCWPHGEVADMVKKVGFHLVRSGVDPNEMPLGWRLSFTRAENLLMKTWNTQQRQCFLALRAFCIKNLSAKGGLGTYILKTLMLWDCEEYPPEASVWEDELGLSVDRLLLTLRETIEDGSCDHYFLQGVNLLDHMTEPLKKSLLESFDNAITSVEIMRGAISSAGVEKACTLAEYYAEKAELQQEGQKYDFDLPVEKEVPVSDSNGNTVTSIFTDQLLESTYETYVRVNMSTSKQDKARAARCRSKFFHALVALYVVTLAVVYGLTSFSPHASLMVFLTFLVAGLLLNLGWSYRWSLSFIYAMVSLESQWSLSWKVAHFVLAFPLAKFISQMMGMFERPLEQQRAQSNKTAGSSSPTMSLTGTPVAKPGLVAPMLFLYGVNFLLMCASRAYGLRNFWDVFVCALANQAHFMVFCPWMELFYREYNQLLVRLKPAICATVCTSLFVMFMLHFGDYNKSFWPWLSMTFLVIGLCSSTCYALPTNLAVVTCVLFSVMVLLPAQVLYVVMGVLYLTYWISLSWQSSPVSRAIRVLTMLCVHLCLQTTSLSAILASVNMVFGCCMYVGCLYSFYTARATRHTSLLHRLSSRLMVVIFVGGVAMLTLQSKPVSTQEAFIMVSAPVAAAMMLPCLEGTLLQTLVKLWKRARARDGGVANHT